MRYFIYLLIILGSIETFAGNWLSKTAINKAKLGQTGIVTYYLKKTCILREAPDKCFNITNKDLRKLKLGLIDNTNSPIYRAPDLSPVLLSCSDFSDCSIVATDPNQDGNRSDRVCIGESGTGEKWDVLTNWPSVTGQAGPWFIWCEKAIGFNKKDALVVDPAGIISADTEDTLNSNRKAARKTKKTSRLLQLKSCVANTKGNSALTPLQIKRCLRSLVREVLKKQVPISDL